MAEELRRCEHGVICERDLEGGAVGVLECSQQLIAGCGVDVSTLIVLTTLIRVLSDNLLLVEGLCTHRDGGNSTGVVRADKGGLDDRRILHCRQYDPKVAVLVPSAETLDRRRVLGGDTMRVSDGYIVRFPRLLGGGWAWESVYDGAVQQGVQNLLFSLVSDC